MKSRELRSLNDQQLLERYEDLKAEMFQMRQNAITGELTDTSIVRRNRREVARLLTILRERELAAELAEGKS